MLLQFDLKMNPFQAGMIYVSTSIGFSLSPLLMPRLVNRHGPWFISLGAILYAASFVLLMIVVMHIPILRFPWLLLPALFALGPTQGMVMMPLLSIVIATVHGECAGMAAGGSLHFAAVGSRVRRDCRQHDHANCAQETVGPGRASSASGCIRLQHAVQPRGRRDRQPAPAHVAGTATARLKRQRSSASRPGRTTQR